MDLTSLNTIVQLFAQFVKAKVYEQKYLLMQVSTNVGCRKNKNDNEFLTTHHIITRSLLSSRDGMKSRVNFACFTNCIDTVAIMRYTTELSCQLYVLLRCIIGPDGILILIV